MSTSNTNSTVYHPLGAVRLLSPAEDQSARSTATGSSNTPTAVKRAVDVLRNFARVWVEAQQHRNGF